MPRTDKQIESHTTLLPCLNANQGTQGGTRYIMAVFIVKFEVGSERKPKSVVSIGNDPVIENDFSLIAERSIRALVESEIENSPIRNVSLYRISDNSVLDGLLEQLINEKSLIKEWETFKLTQSED